MVTDLIAARAGEDDRLAGARVTAKEFVTAFTTVLSCGRPPVVREPELSDVGLMDGGPATPATGNLSVAEAEQVLQRPEEAGALVCPAQAPGPSSHREFSVQP